MAAIPLQAKAIETPRPMGRGQAVDEIGIERRETDEKPARKAAQV
jgi:hypothetical protein